MFKSCSSVNHILRSILYGDMWCWCSVATCSNMHSGDILQYYSAAYCKTPNHICILEQDTDTVHHWSPHWSCTPPSYFLYSPARQSSLVLLRCYLHLLVSGDIWEPLRNSGDPRENVTVSIVRIFLVQDSGQSCYWLWHHIVTSTMCHNPGSEITLDQRDQRTPTGQWPTLLSCYRMGFFEYSCVSTTKEIVP